MPITGADHDASVSGAILTLFAQLLSRLRDELEGLDGDALNWVPTLGANSIATIVTHLIGSESETLRCVAGLPSDRDRELEFEGKEVTANEVLALRDAAHRRYPAPRDHRPTHLARRDGVRTDVVGRQLRSRLRASGTPPAHEAALSCEG